MASDPSVRLILVVEEAPEGTWSDAGDADKLAAMYWETPYLGVFLKRNGDWLSIRDTWNSDHAPASASAAE